MRDRQRAPPRRRPALRRARRFAPDPQQSLLPEVPMHRSALRTQKSGDLDNEKTLDFPASCRAPDD
jgi:hypothetical protein